MVRAISPCSSRAITSKSRHRLRVVRLRLRVTRGRGDQLRGLRLATEALTPASKAWLGVARARVRRARAARVLLCHGSPGQTAEFLYELELDDLGSRPGWTSGTCADSSAPTPGLPWIRQLRGGRFAVNCGAVGNPDHDGDRAVHYAMIDLPSQGRGQARDPPRRIRRRAVRAGVRSSAWPTSSYLRLHRHLDDGHCEPPRRRASSTSAPREPGRTLRRGRRSSCAQLVSGAAWSARRAAIGLRRGGGAGSSISSARTVRISPPRVSPALCTCT